MVPMTKLSSWVLFSQGPTAFTYKTKLLILNLTPSEHFTGIESFVLPTQIQTWPVLSAHIH